MLRAAPAFALVLLVGCSGASPGAEPPASPGAGPAPAASASAAPAPETSAAPAPKATKTTGFPSECAKDKDAGDMCVPEGPFVDRLCKAALTDAALVLFGKTPWTRGYLTRDTEAWNAAGGSTARGKLLFDEEVIVLRKRSAQGIVVGQGGGYDVLRWDGSCASLAQEELTTKKPPKAKTAAVSWRDISNGTRDALLADAKLQAAFEKRRKECKGVTTGDVSAACVKADTALSAGIVDFVRGGGALPAPTLP